MTKEAGLFFYYIQPPEGVDFSFSTMLLLHIFCSWYVFIVFHKGNKWKNPSLEFTKLPLNNNLINIFLSCHFRPGGSDASARVPHLFLQFGCNVIQDQLMMSKH